MFHEAARAQGRGTTWLSHVAAPVESALAPSSYAIDLLDRAAIGGVQAQAPVLGRRSTFQAEVQRTRAALNGTDHKPSRPRWSRSEAWPEQCPATAAGTAVPHYMLCGSSATRCGSPGSPRARPNPTASSAQYLFDRQGHLRFVAAQRGQAVRVTQVRCSLRRSSIFTQARTSRVATCLLATAHHGLRPVRSPCALGAHESK
jgi:hypothetical protein